MLTYAQALKGALDQPILAREKKAAAPPKEPITFDGLPGEVITIIALSKRCGVDRKEEYNLAVKDLCNLRYVNKCTNLRVQHAFGDRCFRHRNHMLSEYSLKGLRDIGRHPTFRRYVREIALGPERIPQKTSPINRNLHPLELRSHYPHLETLRSDQTNFESCGEAVRLLKNAFKNLPRVNRIIIRTYPWLCTSNKLQYHGYDWSAPWGLSTLAASMAPTEELAKNDAMYFEGSVSSNWYLDIILYGMRAIQSRPNWTISFDLNSDEHYIQNMGYFNYTPAAPFAVGCGNWKYIQHRVRQIGLHRSVLSDGRPCNSRIRWLTELFKSCSTKLDTLHFHNSTYWPSLCNQSPLPNLRRIEIRHSSFPEGPFRNFLKIQKNTLESMKLDAVDLINWDPLLGLDYPDWILSWQVHFALMLKMTRLREVSFSHLSWLAADHEALPEDTQIVDEVDGWSKSVKAEGPSVQKVLSLAVQNSAISENTKRSDVWDPWDLNRGHWVMFEITDIDGDGETVAYQDNVGPSASPWCML